MRIFSVKVRAGIRVIVALIYRVIDRFLDGYVQGYMRRKGYGSPPQSIKVIRHYSDAHVGFSNVYRWPRDIGSFEKLSFLFHSSQANFGICLLAFDEAAYLYEIVRSIRAGKIAEIGRFKGGATFLIATAMDQDSHLDSFDIPAPSLIRDENLQKLELARSTLDSELQNALVRYGLETRVNVLVQDSTTVKLADESYDLVFVDGDHSYEGAKKDFLNWKNATKKGGHLLFHDAARTRPFCSAGLDLLTLMAELEKDYAHQFEKIDSVGTLVHFQRVA